MLKVKAYLVEDKVEDIELIGSRKFWGFYLIFLISIAVYMFFKFSLNEILEHPKGLSFIVGFVPAIAYILYMFLRPPKLYLHQKGFEIKSAFPSFEEKWSEVSSFQIVEKGVFKIEKISYKHVSNMSSDENNIDNFIPFSFSYSIEELVNLLNGYRHQALTSNLND